MRWNRKDVDKSLVVTVIDEKESMMSSCDVMLLVIINKTPFLRNILQQIQ